MPETPTTPAGQQAGGAPSNDQQGNPAPQSGTDWQAKFEAQQKVNRDLEAKFNALRDSQDKQAKALAEALGVKPAQAAGDDLAATVAQLRDQFAAAQRDNLVLSVAGEHRITDPEDLDALRAVAGDEARLRPLAARLAPSDTPPQPRAPRPDPNQGRQQANTPQTPAQAFGDFLTRQLSSG